MQSSAVAEEHAAAYLVEPRSDAAERAASAHSPFVIGVTGHRNLVEGDLARARSAVATFFDAIRRLLPDTELKVMLRMAAGGDLVVAETALALGISVEAVLPMPLTEFIVDFDDRNRQLLTGLLGHRNLHYIELPASATGADGSILEGPEWRRAAYQSLTKVLIRKSNLMLALWDGKASRRPGGTTDTVLRYLRVEPDQNCATSRLEFSTADPDADADSPFIYWMPIASAGNDESVAAVPPATPNRRTELLVELGKGSLMESYLWTIHRYHREHAPPAGG